MNGDVCDKIYFVYASSNFYSCFWDIDSLQKKVSK